MKPIDRTGQKFGRLTALFLAPRRGRRVYWLFQCDCGNTKEIFISAVTSGTTRSCGCLHMERCRSGANRRRHGDAGVGAVKRLHSIWRGMLKRCNPANNPAAIERYAARGIGFDPSWSDYVTFRSWALANGYADNLTLDRIDNQAGYGPENCRWADRKTQARNRRTSRYITIRGETKTVAEWVEVTGISAPTAHTRLSRGWTPERTFDTPVKVVAKSG